jgi:hypothetical protein
VVTKCCTFGFAGWTTLMAASCSSSYGGAGTPFTGSAGELDDGDDDDGSTSADDDDDDGGGEDADDGGDDGGVPNGLPCAVDDLLAAHCRTCHADPAKFGAPMPLVRRDDFMVPATTDPASSVGELVRARVHDEETPMPPTGMLEPDALAVLDDWLDAGAPASDEHCGGSDEGGDDGAPDELPCEPTDIFLAHGDGPDGGFEVPIVDDVYMCFTFASPWGPQTQAIAGGPIVDDERVLHHWILYRTSEPQEDGGFGPCNMPFDATFVTGWAPGGENFVMPDDVGLELAGPDEWLILQIHYNNTAGYTDAIDRSGVQICAIDEPRPQTAGILWLGSVLIGVPPQTTGYEVSGTCYTDDWTEPLHVMASSPHMHETGSAFRTEIQRASGGQEMLVDVQHFSFNDQKDYPHDPVVTIQPGDTLTTTCTFDNESPNWVLFGETTSDEMCFNFATAYPIDSLAERTCGIL